MMIVGYWTEAPEADVEQAAAGWAGLSITQLQQPQHQMMSPEDRNQDKTSLMRFLFKTGI